MRPGVRGTDSLGGSVQQGATCPPKLVVDVKRGIGD